MNKLKMWLNNPSKKPGLTNLAYLAELIAVNGGSFDIHAIGSKLVPESPWKRVGLVPNEALDMTGMIQCAFGIMIGVGLDLEQDFHEIIQNEIERQRVGTCIHVATSDEQRRFGKQR